MFKKTKLCTGLVMAFGVLGSATAQQAQQLERVTVTGSNIKRTDTETASPVQMITRQDIERTGKQSIQEVLRSVTADGQGSIPSSFTNGFASGSAAVSLRGLGVNSTLVLVNGRRMTTYGLADDGSRTFVDLNSIPLELVDRVEVLKDGGSAIYGADAVGGVVNVILRKNYNGASVGGTLRPDRSTATGRPARAFGTVGFGNLDTDKYNVFVSLEASQAEQHLVQGPRLHRRRPTCATRTSTTHQWRARGSGWESPRPSTTSPYGVTRTPPAGTGTRVNVIPCDARRSASIRTPGCAATTAESSRKSSRRPSGSTSSAAAPCRSRRPCRPTSSSATSRPRPRPTARSAATTTAASSTRRTRPILIVHGLMTLPAGHPDNTFGVDRTLAYAPAELGGRDQTTKNQVFRIVEGLQGTAWGWDFDVGAAYIKSRWRTPTRASSATT